MPRWTDWWGLGAPRSVQAAEAFVRAGGQWPKERRGGGMEFWEDALRLLEQLAGRPVWYHAAL